MTKWKLGSLPSREPSSTIVRVVDNRVFILGLDDLYRDPMNGFESQTLLPCAQALAKTLHVQPAHVPIEGYYHETPELEEYFRLMRSLQAVGSHQESKVKGLREFQVLPQLIRGNTFRLGQRPHFHYDRAQRPFLSGVEPCIRPHPLT